MAASATPCVLVLAGLDPSGGAGLLADADAIRAAGARPLCVATALTAQTTRRMHGFQPLAPALALQTAQALLEEEPVRAIKVGMVGTVSMANAVAELLARAGLPAVVDPVLSASSGASLFQGGSETARRAYASLWRHAVITPNAPEARLLLDLGEDLVDAEALERAARELVARGAKAALVKGGHAGGSQAVDVLCGASGCERLAGPRLERSARGTGCRLASALAAGLARGAPLPEAARAAKDLVARYLLAAENAAE
jgi:hydroxymethylpyrimidine/phosphomethylpyrimidine kinase